MLVRPDKTGDYLNETARFDYQPLCYVGRQQLDPTATFVVVHHSGIMLRTNGMKWSSSIRILPSLDITRTTTRANLLFSNCAINNGLLTP